MEVPGPNYGLIRVPSSNTIYSLAEPVRNVELEGFKEYDELNGILQRIQKNKGGSKDDCIQLNEYIRTLNEDLDEPIQPANCSGNIVTAEDYIRINKRFKALRNMNTQKVLGWGGPSIGGGRRTRRKGRKSRKSRKGRKTRRSYRV
jgi:hypothetical protein